MRTTSFSVAFVALMLAPALAHADANGQKALDLFEKGRNLARNGRCAEAIAPLQESLRYAEGVGPLLNLGACYETLGKSASAHRAFLRALDAANKNEDKRRDEARERAKAIEKDVSTLMIHVPIGIKPSAEVRVDGDAWPKERWDVPWEIDPGPHDIEVIAPSEPKQTDSVTVKPHGDHVDWAATVATPPKAPSAAIQDVPPLKSTESPAPSSTQRTLGLVIGGAGAVGVVGGIVSGIISISAHSALTGRCTTYPHCDPNDRAQLSKMNDNAQLSGNISTVSLISGLVLLAGGVVLYLTAPKH